MDADAFEVLKKIEQHLAVIAEAVSKYTTPHPCTRQNEASQVQSQKK